MNLGPLIITWKQTEIKLHHVNCTRSLNISENVTDIVPTADSIVIGKLYDLITLVRDPFYNKHLIDQNERICVLKV